jgi:hypothetical protein
MSSTVLTEIESLMSGNTIYNQMIDEWQFLLQSYQGGKTYRDAGHLTKYQLETAQEYGTRLQTTPIPNHCQSVISVYNSFLFRSCPKREFNNFENMPELQDFLKDCDMDGRSLDAFMKDVSTWSSVFGHAWIIVTKPDVGAITRADEIAEGVRPYLSLLTPVSVLDWNWTRLPNGRYALDYLRYVEDINGNIRIIKEWFNDRIITTTVDSDSKSVVTVMEEINGLGKIPAVVAYNGRGLIRGLGISDIADIATAQKFIYNCYSEAEQSVRIDGHPSLVKTPETQAGIGAGSIIHMPENLDPGLKPYALEFSGANIDSVLNVINNVVQSIDQMANTGSIRSTEARRMSGVAQQQEFELLNARLSDKADQMELVEEQMWRLWCEFMGIQYTFEIDYPGSFNIRDTDNEISQLQIAANTNPADPRVKAAIDMKILDWLDLDQDELTALKNPNLIDLSAVPGSSDRSEFYMGKAMIDPESGIVTIASTPEEELAMAKQGWIEYNDDESGEY